MRIKERNDAMAYLERKKKGQKYKVCVDAVKHIYEALSFWTHSDDVTFDDGETLTEKMAKIEKALNLD